MLSKLITKKNVLIIAIIGAVAYFSLIVFWHDCYAAIWCRQSTIFHLFQRASWLAVFPGLLIGSLLTWKLKQRVFMAWSYFTCFWIPLSILFIATTPSVSHSWAVSFGPKPETVIFVANSLFLVFSLVIIAYESYKLRGK